MACSTTSNEDDCNEDDCNEDDCNEASSLPLSPPETSQTNTLNTRSEVDNSGNDAALPPLVEASQPMTVLTKTSESTYDVDASNEILIEPNEMTETLPMSNDNEASSEISDKVPEVTNTSLKNRNDSMESSRAETANPPSNVTETEAEAEAEAEAGAFNKTESPPENETKTTNTISKEESFFCARDNVEPSHPVDLSNEREFIVPTLDMPTNETTISMKENKFTDSSCVTASTGAMTDFMETKLSKTDMSVVDKKSEVIVKKDVESSTTEIIPGNNSTENQNGMLETDTKVEEGNAKKTPNSKLPEWIFNNKDNENQDLTLSPSNPDDNETNETNENNSGTSRTSLDTWEDNFKKLKEYKDKYGNCHVPRKHDSHLYRWIGRQRYAYNHTRERMGKDKIGRLNSLGFIWKIYGIYSDNVEQEVKRLYVDPLKNPPNSLTEDLKPTSNMEEDDYYFEDDSAYHDNMKGWTGKRYSTWKRNFEKLVQYKKREGHCRVEKDQDPQLYGWVVRQRHTFHHFHRRFLPEQIINLNKLGFVWNIYKADLDDMVREKIEVKEESMKQKEQLQLAIKEAGPLPTLTPSPTSTPTAGEKRKRDQLDEQHSTSPDEKQPDTYSIWTPKRRQNWETQFAKLKEYKEKHGNLNISKSDVDTSLYNWICRQRHGYNQGKNDPSVHLPADVLKRLIDIGFIWNVYGKNIPTNNDTFVKKKERNASEIWNAHFFDLKSYQLKHGHLRVEKSNPEFPFLANWIRKQRKDHNLLLANKEAPLTLNQIVQLNSIGFDWNSYDSNRPKNRDEWTTRYKQLQSFKIRHGHCNVPLNYPDNIELGLWVATQRDHFERLTAIQFKSTTVDRPLREIRMEELLAYKKEFGDCAVPKRWPRNPKLGQWVSEQRRQYKYFKNGKSSYMTQERIRELESVGFVWSVYKSAESIRKKKTIQNEPNIRTETEKPCDEVQVKTKVNKNELIYL